MDKRSYSVDINNHMGLIHKFARKAYGRLEQARVIIDYEDVYQDMCVTFTKASQKWNPEAGVSFTAYLGTSIWNEFNKFAEKEINFNMKLGMRSVDDMEESARCAGTLFNDTDFLDGIVANVGYVKSSEEIVSHANDLRKKIRRLSKPAKLVLLDLISPSSAVKTAHKRVRDYSKVLRERGASYQQYPLDINFHFISQHRQISRYEMRRIKTELGSVFEVEI